MDADVMGAMGAKYRARTTQALISAVPAVCYLRGDELLSATDLLGSHTDESGTSAG